MALTAYELHEQAQLASKHGDHIRAAAIWLTAAQFARTPEGAEVLRQLSREATNRAELQRQRETGRTWPELVAELI